MFEEMPARYLFGFLALSVMVSVIILFEISANSLLIDVVVQLVLYVVVPVLYFGYHFRKQKKRITTVVFMSGVDRWVLIIVGLVLLSFMFSASMLWFRMYLLLPLAPWLVDFMLEPPPSPGGSYYVIFTVIVISVIGPIAEEFIFRGVLLKRLIAKTTMWSGVLISSLFFGILHSDILGAFLFGVVASLLYLRTNNLLVPIMFHAVNNSLAALFMFVPDARPEWLFFFTSAEVYSRALPYATMLIGSAGLTAWAIIRLSKGLDQKLKDEAYARLDLPDDEPEKELRDVL
ncbi:CPBP family intramembrane glutamic endopeptidase [Planococcus sp. YIM B11945]|uniref:CPBP family intramembrane glutamic endopeptidase n=1 Tax=Planococcus sp. YIM B11945 TaxID=3435410 RepID=UPI003D7CC1C2